LRLELLNAHAAIEWLLRQYRIYEGQYSFPGQQLTMSLIQVVQKYLRPQRK
jgi:hypothetical protein